MINHPSFTTRKRADPTDFNSICADAANSADDIHKQYVGKPAGSFDTVMHYGVSGKATLYYDANPCYCLYPKIISRTTTQCVFKIVYVYLYGGFLIPSESTEVTITWNAAFPDATYLVFPSIIKDGSDYYVEGFAIKSTQVTL